MPDAVAYERDDTGRPLFRQSFVLFLDILGIKDLARGAHAADVLVRLDTAVEEGRRLSQDTANLPWWTTSWFSDSVSLAAPIKYRWDQDRGEPEFGTFVNVASGVQFALALEGFFTRGGAAFGMHFSDRNVTFGPALVEAVLEEARVTYPFVGVHESLLEVVRPHLAFYGSPPSHAPHDKNLRVTDGRPFINYLYSAYDFVGESLEEASDLLERHRGHIRERLLDSGLGPRVHAKYGWLADYHNDFCRTEHLRQLEIPEAPGRHVFALFSSLA